MSPPFQRQMPNGERITRPSPRVRTWRHDTVAEFFRLASREAMGPNGANPRTSPVIRTSSKPLNPRARWLATYLPHLLATARYPA